MAKTKTIDMRLVAIAVVAIIIGGIYGASVLFMAPSWETVAGTDHFIVNGMRVDVASSRNIYGYGYAEAALSDFKVNDGLEDDRWAEAPRYTGSTAVVYSVAGPTHVSWNAGLQDWVPDQTDDVPFQQYTKTVGEVDYTYDHHVYEVSLMGKTAGESVVWTVPDRYMGTCDGLPSATLLWSPPGSDDYYMPEDMDHSANFRAFILVSLKPWEIYTGMTLPLNDSYHYRVEDAFYGIMGASTIDITLGWVNAEGEPMEAPAEPTEGYGGVVMGGIAQSSLQKGYQLNLYSADESSLGTGWYDKQTDDGNEETLGSIVGVPAALMFEVSGQLEPGLVVTYGDIAGATWSSSTPAQRFLQVRVRVDVLTAQGLVLVSGAQPIGTTVPLGDQPPPDWANMLTSFLESLGEWLSNPLNILLMIAVIVVVVIVIAVVFGGGIPLLMKRGRKQ